MFWRCPGRAQELTKKLLQAPFHLPLSFFPLSLSFLSFLLPSPFRFPSFLWFLLPIALLSALFHPTFVHGCFSPHFSLSSQGDPAQIFFMDLPNSSASAWISTIFFQKKYFSHAFGRKERISSHPSFTFHLLFLGLHKAPVWHPQLAPELSVRLFQKSLFSFKSLDFVFVFPILLIHFIWNLSLFSFL